MNEKKKDDIIDKLVESIEKNKDTPEFKEYMKKINKSVEDHKNRHDDARKYGKRVAKNLIKKYASIPFKHDGKIYHDKGLNTDEASAAIAEILYQTTDHVIVNIHMDYLYRGYARHFLISGKELNLHCDLFENTIKITGNQNQLIRIIEFKDFERNDMHFNLIKDYIKGLTNSGYKCRLPSFNDNESVMKTCFQINRAPLKT